MEANDGDDAAFAREVWVWAAASSVLDEYYELLSDRIRAYAPDCPTGRPEGREVSVLFRVRLPGHRVPGQRLRRIVPTGVRHRGRPAGASDRHGGLAVLRDDHRQGPCPAVRGGRYQSVHQDEVLGPEVEVHDRFGPPT